MVPKDRYNLVYIILFLHGIGALIAWNMFINADRATLFIVTVILATIDSSEWPEAFFWITICSAFAINMANGIFQPCVYGIAAKLPIKYTNAVTIGFNLSGVVAAIFMIISIAIAPSHQVVAIYFFSFAVFYLLFSVCNEWVLRKCNYYLHFMAIESTLNTENSDSIDLKSYKQNKTNETMDNLKPETKDQELSGLSLYIHVLRKIWLFILIIALNYFITFSLFPSLQANISPLNHVIDNKYFVPVFCFLLFPLCKTIGSYLAQLFPKPSVKSLIIYSLFRIAFIPFYVLCNYNAHDRNMPVIIKNDYVYILGATLMALTSGHLTSICMMYAPKSVEPKYASIAGMMASFTILFGILLGLNFSLIYPILVKL